MYLPTMDVRQRKEITEDFFRYRRLTQTNLWDKYSAYEHWAKLEVLKDKDELAALQARLRDFPWIPTMKHERIWTPTAFFLTMCWRNCFLSPRQFNKHQLLVSA